MAASSDQRHGLRVAAVIFDLDGVIVDSEIWWHEERVAWATGLGRSWSAEDSQAVMGANSRAWARIMRERKGLPPVPNASVPPAPGAADLATYVLGRLADLDPGPLPITATPGGVTGARATRRLRRCPPTIRAPPAALRAPA